MPPQLNWFVFYVQAYLISGRLFVKHIDFYPGINVFILNPPVFCLDWQKDIEMSSLCFPIHYTIHTQSHWRSEALILNLPTNHAGCDHDECFMALLELVVVVALLALGRFCKQSLAHPWWPICHWGLLLLGVLKEVLNELQMHIIW